MAPLPIRDCPRRGFGRVPPVTNRDVEFPGAESMFSRLCGGISGRRGGVPPHRGRPRRRFGRVPPVTNRGLGFPGTESIFSRPCSGIPGRRDGAPSPQGRPRRGFGLVPPLTGEQTRAERPYNLRYIRFQSSVSQKSYGLLIFCIS